MSLVPNERGESGRTVRDFFNIEADVLLRRFETVERLLPSERLRGAAHAGEEGRHIESLLRDFLNRHLPLELHAFSGFILRPATKRGMDDFERVSDGDRHSAQLDVIVYDRARYPIYEQFEEFVIVPPEGVVAIISVKKSLYRPQMRKELESLAHAAELCTSAEQPRGPHLGLFAFRPNGGWSNERWAAEIIADVQKTMAGRPFNHLINEVSVLNRFVIFKYAPKDSKLRMAKFVRCDVSESNEHLPLGRILQSIFSVYYGRPGAPPRPGFVHFPKGTFGDAPEVGLVPYSEVKRSSKTHQSED